MHRENVHINMSKYEYVSKFKFKDVIVTVKKVSKNLITTMYLLTINPKNYNFLYKINPDNTITLDLKYGSVSNFILSNGKFKYNGKLLETEVNSMLTNIKNCVIDGNEEA